MTESDKKNQSARVRPFAGVAPRIHPSAFIAETATVIGDVEIGEGASIWYGCVLRGDIHCIRIGAGTNIQDGTIIHVQGPREGHTKGLPTLIGDHVTIGHACLIHACSIGDHAFVGMRATVLDGAEIAPGGMIGANSLLAPGKRIGPGDLWVGTPARFRRALTEADRAEYGWIAGSYSELASRFRMEAASDQMDENDA